MDVNEVECAAVGLDPKAVAGIAKRIERAALDAQKLGITVFGGSTCGTLRFDDQDGPRLILADMRGSWDGEDGGYGPAGSDGMIRGE